MGRTLWREIWKRYVWFDVLSLLYYTRTHQRQSNVRSIFNETENFLSIENEFVVRVANAVVNSGSEGTSRCYVNWKSVEHPVWYKTVFYTSSTPSFQRNAFFFELRFKSSRIYVRVRKMGNLTPNLNIKTGKHRISTHNDVKNLCQPCSCNISVCCPWNIPSTLHAMSS